MAGSPIDRLRKMCLSLPETFEKTSHGEPTFWVGKKMLVSRSPDRYFVPPYVGASGWVGTYLDRAPDWAAVAERLGESYRLAAPTRLLQERGDAGAPRP